MNPVSNPKIERANSNFQRSSGDGIYGHWVNNNEPLCSTFWEYFKIKVHQSILCTLNYFLTRNRIVLHQVRAYAYVLLLVQ